MYGTAYFMLVPFIDVMQPCIWIPNRSTLNAVFPMFVSNALYHRGWIMTMKIKIDNERVYSFFPVTGRHLCASC